MTVWVWLGWITVVWFGSALEDGTMTGPDGGSVSVWKFVNASHGLETGRPQLLCGTMSVSLRFSTWRHSSLQLQDGTSLMLLPDRCGGSVQTVGPWLQLELPYSRCLVQTSDGAAPHQLSFHYFDRVLQTEVSAVVSCHKPKQSLVLPSIHCGPKEITVKLPPEARPERVRTLGRYAVDRGTYTITGPVVMKISNTEETDSLLEIIYLDSDGEMSTILVPCFTAAKRGMGTQHPKALGGQDQPNVTIDTPSTKDPLSPSVADLKSSKSLKMFSTIITDVLTATTFPQENTKYTSSGSDVSNANQTTTNITAAPPNIRVQSRTPVISSATTHLDTLKKLEVFLPDASVITASTNSATPSPIFKNQTDHLKSTFNSKAAITSSTTNDKTELITETITQTTIFKVTSDIEDPNTTPKTKTARDALIKTNEVTYTPPSMTAFPYTASTLNEGIDDYNFSTDSRKFTGDSNTISHVLSPSIPIFTMSQAASMHQNGLHTAKASRAKTKPKNVLETLSKNTPTTVMETGSVNESLTYLRSSKPAHNTSPTSSTHDLDLASNSSKTTVLLATDTDSLSQNATLTPDTPTQNQSSATSNWTVNTFKSAASITHETLSDTPQTTTDPQTNSALIMSSTTTTSNTSSANAFSISTPTSSYYVNSTSPTSSNAKPFPLHGAKSFHSFKTFFTIGSNAKALILFRAKLSHLVKTPSTNGFKAKAYPLYRTKSPY
ncbi:uncharacterized protein LOC144996333 [Oryzias latipes]